MQRRKPWENDWRKFFKDVEPSKHEFIPLPDWVYRGVQTENSYTIECATHEEFERMCAMIDFCTKYEKESFELFYKWFKQNKGKED